jgi:hypothetical protein
LDDLVKASLIEYEYDDDDDCYRMHDLIHDFATGQIEGFPEPALEWMIYRSLLL